MYMCMYVRMCIFTYVRMYVHMYVQWVLLNCLLWHNLICSEFGCLWGCFITLACSSVYVELGNSCPRVCRFDFARSWLHNHVVPLPAELPWDKSTLPVVGSRPTQGSSFLSRVLLLGTLLAT